MKQPDSLEHIVSIHLDGLQFLQLFRPATEDLILTKMMRVDPQDRSDIKFLLQQEYLDSNHLERLIHSAKIPPITEIREVFEQNTTWLRHLKPNP